MYYDNYALIKGRKVWLGRQRSLGDALTVSRKWRKHTIITEVAHGPR